MKLSEFFPFKLSRSLLERSARERMLIGANVFLLFLFVLVTFFRFWSSFTSDPVHRVRSLYKEEERLGGTGVFLMIQGRDLHAALSSVGDLLFGDDDRSRIVDALLRTASLRTFGEEVDLFSLLSRFPDTSYAFFLRGEESDLQWLLAIAAPHEDLAKVLHDGFASQFSPAIIRERAVPSGMVRDIISDVEGLEQEEELLKGFALFSTRYLREDREFVSARHKKILLLSNARELVLRAIKED